MSLTAFILSAFFERAAVNKVDDLRGLGIRHQQAFLQNGAMCEICKKSVLVQEGIACQYRIYLFMGLETNENNQSRPRSAFHFVIILSISLIVLSSLFLILSMASLLQICSNGTMSFSIISKT